MKYEMPAPAGTVQRYSSEGLPYSEPSGEFTEVQMQAAYQAGRDSMAAEVDAVRGAKIDCVDQFNALKADYDAFCIAAGVPAKVEYKSSAGLVRDGKVDVFVKHIWSKQTDSVARNS